MNFLIDTHIVLWWLYNDSLLSRKEYEAIGDHNNSVFVSSISAWELSLKKNLGKLDVPDDFLEALSYSNFTPLALTVAHGGIAGALPLHHRDPFDRMIIAQAQSENLTVITHDRYFSRYDVPIFGE